MIELRLHGWLKERYGKVFRFHARDIGGCIRLMQANFTDFRQRVIEDEFFVVRGEDLDGGECLVLDQLKLRMPGEVIHLVPKICGAKQGMWQTILGAVLVVVGALTWYFGGTALSAAGLAMMKVGGAMVIGGVVQMLTATSSTTDQNAGAEDVAERRSFIFDGALQNYRQGGPVMIAYGGPVMIGSNVVSSGLKNEQIPPWA